MENALVEVNPEASELNEENRCACGAESTRGCHGFTNGVLYNEYYCDDCYNKKD